ncbi:Pentatricopeptide repeat [Ceraceosorus bombacis]|uniref:Pentatricopeptide repeat n=1 Tax=Ceraceosorus bombacis TaxID=401625 RepID=A0A0N7L8Z9_9BASI|nr:Pentatricopeptide repeat [Ceraceosorus bombacis]
MSTSFAVQGCSSALWQLLTPSLHTTTWHSSANLAPVSRAQVAQGSRSVHPGCPARAFHASPDRAKAEDDKGVRNSARLFGGSGDDRSKSQIERAIRLKAIERRRPLRSRPPSSEDRNTEKDRRNGWFFCYQLMELLRASRSDAEGSYRSGLEMWERRPKLGPNAEVQSYNRMIALASRASKPSKALDFIEQLKKAGHAPDADTYSALFASVLAERTGKHATLWRASDGTRTRMQQRLHDHFTDLLALAKRLGAGEAASTPPKPQLRGASTHTPAPSPNAESSSSQDLRHFTESTRAISSYLWMLEAADEVEEGRKVYANLSASIPVPPRIFRQSLLHRGVQYEEDGTPPLALAQILCEAWSSLRAQWESNYELLRRGKAFWWAVGEEKEWHHLSVIVYQLLRLASSNAFMTESRPLPKSFALSIVEFLAKLQDLDSKHQGEIKSVDTSSRAKTIHLAGTRDTEKPSDSTGSSFVDTRWVDCGEIIFRMCVVHGAVELLSSLLSNLSADSAAKMEWPSDDTISVFLHLCHSEGKAEAAQTLIHLLRRIVAVSRDALDLRQPSSEDVRRPAIPKAPSLAKHIALLYRIHMTNIYASAARGTAAAEIAITKSIELFKSDLDLDLLKGSGYGTDAHRLRVQGAVIALMRARIHVAGNAKLIFGVTPQSEEEANSLAAQLILRVIHDKLIPLESPDLIPDATFTPRKRREVSSPNDTLPDVVGLDERARSPNQTIHDVVQSLKALTSMAISSNGGASLDELALWQRVLVRAQAALDLVRGSPSSKRAEGKPLNEGPRRPRDAKNRAFEHNGKLFGKPRRDAKEGLQLTEEDLKELEM